MLSNDDEQAPPVIRLRERVVYENGFITVYDDDVAVAGAPRRHLRVVESKGRAGAAVLALSRGRVALVRTYRYATESWEYGIPRGFAHGHDAAATACTELTEELGRRPDQLTPMGSLTPNSGLLSSVVFLYLARYDVSVDTPQDSEEVVEVLWIPVRELLDSVASGEITDGFTLAAIGVATARGLLAR